MAPLLDDEGTIHDRGFLSGTYDEQQGIFGLRKDANWLGQPNVKTNFFGQPVAARDFFGQTITSSDGRPLYESASSSGGMSGGAEGAIALAVIVISFLAVLGALWLTAWLLSLVYRALCALLETYAGLWRAHTRTALVLHIFGSTALAFFALSAEGADPTMTLVGTALVPVAWVWLILTILFPLVLMPINAIGLGATLYVAAEAARPSWQITWTRLSSGLPGLDHLSLVLAAVPLALYAWVLGHRRWPLVFTPVAHLLVGFGLWLSLTRAWVAWQPAWSAWVAPLPFAPPVAVVLLAGPLAIWLWAQGQARWPLAFAAWNLLVLGSLLGLTAVHTETVWDPTWRYWSQGTPFSSAPILAIAAAPVTAWSWNLGMRFQPKLFVVPNLVLTGAILWLVLDRTRPLWLAWWGQAAGPTFARVDPAAVFLVLPLAVWLWRRGSAEWPRHWGAARAVLVGALLWVIAERARAYWLLPWSTFAGPRGVNLALVAALFPPVFWVFGLVRRRYPAGALAVTLIALALCSAWLLGAVFPESSALIRLLAIAIPFATWGWLWLLGRHTWLGLAVPLVPAVALAIVLARVPGAGRSLVAAMVGALASQGVHVPPTL